MCKSKFFVYTKIMYNIISSDCFANLISFFSLIAALIALFIGGKKVSEALLEYQRKKSAAVFSYHINMKVFIIRLKRLISTSQHKPMKNLFLFSSEDKIHAEGIGYEKIAERLVDLSQKILDYLSTKPNQIPASITDNETKQWDSLIEELINYLADFLLYNTDSYLPQFDNIEGIESYYKSLMNVLDNMLVLIDKSKNEFKKDMYP